MQHLTTLQFQELKIDPSYIAGSKCEPRTHDLVPHISALAHTLGLLVVAEGVEDAAQLKSVKIAGCDLAQGHYIASPLEFSMVPELLEDLPLRTERCETKTRV